MVVGRERAPLTGTPHLQGYLHFEHGISFSGLKRLLPGVHFEKARGDGKSNQTYCTKEGDFFEVGALPEEKGAKTQELWRSLLKAAEEGRWDYIKDNQPRIWITMKERLLSMRVPTSVVLDGDTMNEWWVGPTGSGKSRLAWQKYGDLCYQKQLNKWWDGYDNQSVVIIEEWSPKNDVTSSALKIWADRYPFSAQIKGGMLQKIRPLKIIVISNYTIEDCFVDSRDANPISRRFTVRNFPQDTDEAAKIADDFLVTYGLSNQDSVQPESDIPTPESFVDDDVEMSILGDVSEAFTLTGQNWMDYATADDFNRLLMLGGDAST